MCCLAILANRAHWRRSFGVPVRLGARALGRGEQLAGALDVAGSNRAGDEAVVAKSVVHQVAIGAMVATMSFSDDDMED